LAGLPFYDGDAMTAGSIFDVPRNWFLRAFFPNYHL